MNNMLVITPDLSLNGANIVLIELLEILSENYSLEVLASEGGQIENQLQKLNIEYRICPSVNKNNVPLEKYDEILLNTSSVHFYAPFFQNTLIPVHWWFHESYEQLSCEKENFVHLCLLSDNFHFYGVTPKVIRGLKDLYNVDAALLPMPIKDTYQSVVNSIECPQKIIFIPGAYTYIKGQDILLTAINRLPQNIADDFEFVFAGYRLPSQDEYYIRLKELSKRFSNVTMLDSLSREDIYNYYQKSICVVAPSRVDSTPTTIVEALMHQKICLVSQGAGISELMTDCVNGFIYPTDNVDELFKRLLFILHDYQTLDDIALAGRQLYCDYFEPEKIKELIIKYFH